jgi:hypothetical protein
MLKLALGSRFLFTDLLLTSNGTISKELVFSKESFRLFSFYTLQVNH